MKKEYMKPAMCIVRIEHQHIICTSITDTDGNGGLGFGGGGKGPARARGFGGWDDDWDDWDE